MKIRTGLSCVVLGLAAAAAAAQTAPLTFDGAQWIWFTTDPKLPLSAFPEGSVFFRAALNLPALLKQLSSDGLKVSAAQRLAIYRDPAAAPALAACLCEPVREVRAAAALSLAACGTRAGTATTVP